jgi:hypothetical protein
MINLRLSLLFICSLLGTVACSYSPVGLITDTSSQIGLLNKVTIDRQGSFTVSSRSHLGLMIMPASADAFVPNQETSKQWSKNEGSIDMLFTNVGNRAFRQFFSEVTVFDPKATPLNVDFLIKASLLHIDDQTVEKNKSKPQEKASDLESKEVTVRKRIIPKPHQAIIKLNLFDARKEKIIDVAIIKARSGAITHSDYGTFLQESLVAYADSIVATGRIVSH